MSGLSNLAQITLSEVSHLRGHHLKVKPNTDIVDNGADVLVLVNLPGVELCNISLELDGHELTVSGHSCCENKPQALPLRMLSMEFVDVQYCLTLELSPEVDDTAVRAFLCNGVLAINLPRRPRVKRQILIEHD